MIRSVRTLSFVYPRFSGKTLIGLLGHELQHAAEIAGEPSVVGDRSLAAFYRRAGFASTAGGENASRAPQPSTPDIA